MAKKFDPSPKDKHADNSKEVTKAGKLKGDLDEGLEESFPASDPASAAQPKNKE
jgi:hypothetical protein